MTPYEALSFHPLLLQGARGRASSIALPPRLRTRLAKHVLPDLVSKRDLEQALERTTHTLTVRLVGVMLGITGLTNAVQFALLHLVPPAPPPALRHASAPSSGIVLAADQSFDWDRYHARQDACREADRIAAQCEVERNAVFNSFVRRGPPERYCDELALRQAQRACSAFYRDRR